MKRLVIHPKDKTTDFLCPIYDGLNATVVTGGATRDEIKDMIKEHDQVMMLGHGTPNGLLSIGNFPFGWGHIIDDSCASVLAEKDNSIFIWCNADQYVKYNKLKGFFTGMFISEVAEAKLMGLPLAQQHAVDESNAWFVSGMKKVAADDVELMHSYIKHDYGEITHRNPIANYNCQRLYVSC